MGRFRHVLAVLPLALGAGLLSAVPAQAGSAPSSVLLSLAQRPGTAAALHQLARTPLAPAATGPAAARAAVDRRTRLAALAPDTAHLDAVLAFASAHDLDVQRADRWTVTLTGAGDVLADLFGTTLSHGRATSPLHVPAALRTDVAVVSGLDDRPLLRTHAVPYGYDGSAMRVQYGVPQDGTWTGAGVTVGTLNLTGWDPTDLTHYAASAGITLAPGQIATIPVDSPANPLVPDGSGDDFEVTMDAQSILATAPQAKQRMYFAPNNGVGTVDVFNQMATDGTAGLLQVASSSWGLCEKDLQPYPTYVQQVGQAIDRMLAAGVTLFAAAGDSGKYDCSYPGAVDNTPSVDFPASYPGTVAVGGTSLPSIGAAETVWGSLLASPGSTQYAGSGGGGGRSALFALPSYQQGVGGSETQRLVPDVASLADPATGMGIYNGGYWYKGGGTSLGAPTWAGLTAAAISAAGRTTGLGDVHTTLYGTQGTFTDVTSGSNGFAAGPGFDLATGLGTPVWSTLGPAVTGAAPVPPSDTAAPSAKAAAVLSPGTDTRVRFTWSGSDPSPSSGLGAYVVSVAQVGGATVWSATTTGTTAGLRLSAGRTYVLTVRATDVVGHVSSPVTARVTVPYDDLSSSHTGSWARGWSTADFSGSHLYSRTAGSSVSMTVTARTLTLGFVKAPNAGYADVYVDGRRVARVDLFASSVLRRQAVRVLSATTAARHTVKVVVVGAHRSGATGSYVMPDSVLAAL